jgi:hypothetical protein
MFFMLLPFILTQSFCHPPWSASGCFHYSLLTKYFFSFLFSPRQATCSKCSISYFYLSYGYYKNYLLNLKTNSITSLLPSTAILCELILEISLFQQASLCRSFCGVGYIHMSTVLYSRIHCSKPFVQYSKRYTLQDKIDKFSGSANCFKKKKKKKKRKRKNERNVR